MGVLNGAGRESSILHGLSENAHESFCRYAVLVVVAVLVSRGTWTYIRRPTEGGRLLSQGFSQHPTRVT